MISVTCLSRVKTVHTVYYTAERNLSFLKFKTLVLAIGDGVYKEFFIKDVYKDGAYNVLFDTVI